MWMSARSSQSVNTRAWLRRRPISTCGALVLWTLIAFYVYAEQTEVDVRARWHDWHESASTRVQWWSSASSDNNNGMCDVSDIVHGDWVDDPSVGEWDDLLARYNYHPGASIDCKDSEGQQAAELEPPTPNDRPYRVALPCLQPARPTCQMYAFDETAYITRLLRSPAGMFLVGDSLTDHHMQVVINLLQSPSGLVKRTVTGGAKGRMVDVLHLNKHHADAARFLALAGVPEARLDLPLVSFWRDVHLLSAEEKERVFATAGGRYRAVESYANMPEWYPLMMDVLHRSDAFVTDMVAPEPNILVLNTGAHWKHDALGEELSEEDILGGYRNMITLVEDKIATTPYPLATFWRTMAPGQIDCSLLDEFDNMRANSTSPANPAARAYNYHLFEQMNDDMRFNSSFRREEGAFNHLSTPAPLVLQSQKPPTNPRFRLMDVWPMSAKRPEAHLNSAKGDCLHWCRPGVQDHWQALLWHMIVDESLHDDYQQPHVAARRS